MVTKEELIKLNSAYRLGFPEVSDEVYDKKKEEYESIHGEIVLMDLGFGEKILLRNRAGSLKKKTSLDKLFLAIGHKQKVWIAPKLDGISISLEDYVASTRGDDGIVGNLVTHHFRHINNPTWANGRGEVVFSTETFSKHIEPLGYRHPRNAIGGLFNPATMDSNVELLEKAEFVRYFDEKDGMELCDKLWVEIDRNVLSEEYLLEKYKEYSEKYPCDGIVVALDKKVEMGDGVYPTNVFAYKSKAFDLSVESHIVRIERPISKYGVANPVLVIKPVLLDGAEISNIYVDNEAFVKSLGLGVGTKIRLKRSGGIIPRLTEANGINIEAFERKYLTDLMHSSSKEDMGGVFETLVQSFGGRVSEYNYENPDFEFEWSGLNIVQKEQTSHVIKRKIEYFLQTLGCKNVGTKTVSQIVDRFGVNSLEKFLQFDFDLLLDLGYGGKEIQNMKKGLLPMRSVQEHKLMQATSYFEMLGASKLKLYLTDGLDAKGLGDYAKGEIQKNLPRWVFFRDFWTDTLKYELLKVTGGGDVYCHTMCRIPKDVIQKMEADGKEVVDGYSKKVRFLVVPSLDVTSTKIKKGLEDGVVLILLSDLVARYSNKGSEASLF